MHLRSMRPVFRLPCVQSRPDKFGWAVKAQSIVCNVLYLLPRYAFHPMNHHSNPIQVGRRLRRRHVILQSASPRQINANKPPVIGSFLNVPALPSATFLATSSILQYCTCTHDLQGEFLVYWKAPLPRLHLQTGSCFDHGPNNGYEEASFDAGCKLPSHSAPVSCPGYMRVPSCSPRVLRTSHLFNNRQLTQDHTQVSRLSRSQSRAFSSTPAAGTFLSASRHLEARNSRN